MNEKKGRWKGNIVMVVPDWTSSFSISFFYFFHEFGSGGKLLD